VRHFWPEFNAWLTALPDTRHQPFVDYDRRLLLWWGLLLFVCKLGSRRQLDFDLRAAGAPVLAQVNRLAGTQHARLPVHDTLDHFLGHVGSAALVGLRLQMVQRLIRMKALDRARLLGHLVVAVDGTGYLHFTRPHCAQCLVRHFDHGDVFLHMVEEAKLVGPGGLVVSLATTFIENADLPAAARSTTWKQDCELSAFKRLLPMLHAACPQLRVCLTSDALYACGPVLEAMATYGWAYVFTFKAGHLPTAWEDFQALLPLCPENCLRVTLPRGGQQVYRWVTGMAYVDTRKRVHTFQAIQCEETVAGTTTTFAWMTNLPVTRDTVMAIAMKGGRRRWLIENQGFNLQKNSELNLEHAYSEDPDGLKTYYYLLQIAHTMLQLLEHGSLLHHLAADVGKTPVQLFGSLKNIARRLLEDFRHAGPGDDTSAQIQIRFDTS
jgi:hypothetical protein